MSEALIKTLLEQRGISRDEEIAAFLNPDYGTHLHNPFLLKDMDAAVSRILKAIQGDEYIVIYTDYDTDGTPAGVVLHDFFKKIGYTNFQNYIPHRHREGYGLNTGAIMKFAGEGARVIVTADCGISDIEEVTMAQKAGIDVIVTDHHLPHQQAGEDGVVRDELPPACAVINPNREDDTYPYRHLCGAGVAFKLVQALLTRGRELGMFSVPEGREKWLLDMVAIATVSDMVPLTGENRALAYYGLKVLRKSPRHGLMKLFRNLSVDQRYLTEDDIGFVIGPRINAASRMDDPIHGFYFLSAGDENTAARTYAHLEDLNTKRKWLVANIMKEAHARLAEKEPERVIVMGNPRWQPGVLGLAANTLCQSYKRPVFLWGRGESDVLKGSCRSDTVNLVRLMERARESFSDFGGHAGSGGFSIPDDKIHFLEEALFSAFDAMRESGEHMDIAAEKRATVSEPVKLPLREVTEENWGRLRALAPFGTGNPKPIFLFENVPVRGVSRFGKEKNHLMLVLETDEGVPVRAVDFFSDGKWDMGNIVPGARITVSAHIEQNVFRGRAEIRLRILEIQM